MSGDELMFVLQCCSPSEKFERNCAECPLRGNRKCHTELCEHMITFIMNQKAKSEHMGNETAKMLNSLSAMDSFLRS